MLEDQGAILERLQNGALTDSDIQQLSQLLKQAIRQSVEQSGKFNVAMREGTDVHVGDVNYGYTCEEFRLLIQEFRTLHPSESNLLSQRDGTDGNTPDDIPFRKLILDFTTIEAINAQLDIIKEICESGYLPGPQQPDLRQLKQSLISFNVLNEELQSIATQGDLLIKSTVESIRLQLDAIKLSGQELTEEAQSQLSKTDFLCQQAEAQALKTFTNRLADGRAGADWIGKNTETLTKYACRKLKSQFLDLDLSTQDIDDFRFSLKQFLEQISFSLYWGTYEILDSPEIPLVLAVECYEFVFQNIKKSISTQLRDETIYEIESCFDYLIERLPFY